METRSYQVELVYRQKVRYQVEAEDPEAAEELAIEKWRNEERGMLLGHECCELISIAAAEARSPDRSAADCELVLRFLRDRELVIEALDEDIFNPTIHDAVSAEEVARHLEWSTTDRDGEPIVDVARATQALEELCRQQRVVCFSRPRMRWEERGQIRLYCTPQHLEKLTDLLEVQEPDDAEAAAAEEADQPAEAGVETR
ncbi:MAG TPA: hypothetical protein VGR27_09450 [Longimicrobiaceae bacterium]|nr:hypothetical protein [Longimicrobiaceae bacterium]